MKQENKDNATGFQNDISGGTSYLGNNNIYNYSPNKTVSAVKHIPPAGAAQFVGRNEELATIHSLLYEQKNTVVISAVAGMGGIGKTELAIKYAREHENDYPGGICWLNAIEGNLATEILQFARSFFNLKVPQKDAQGNPLTLNQQVAWCWQNWQPTEGLVLVIFDDVNDKENWRAYLPKNNRFRVLLTSRLQDFDIHIKKIALNVFSLEEALEILIAMAGSRKINRELETAKQLCKWFGYLPLGVELAGRYIANKPPHLTLAKIFDEIKQQQEQERINPIQETLITTQRSVKAAFELSWAAAILI
ncbi:NB-ARC domain-containing protein, partial [Aetokthonos hydrillicola]